MSEVPTPRTEDPEAMAQVLAHLVADLGQVEPIEQICRPNHQGFLWGAAYEITDEDITRTIELEPRSESVELELEFHREHLLGHWVITGLEAIPGRAVQFRDLEGAQYGLAAVENYFAGGGE